MTTGNNTENLVPAINCWVTLHSQRAAGGAIRRGMVTALSEDDKLALVQWGADTEPTWHEVSEIRNGFYPGLVVQDRPLSNTRRTLGTGTVRGERNIAGRDMVLVQWHSSGQNLWMPFQNLVGLRGPAIRYIRREITDPDSHERFRLKAYAYALDAWNQVTGALDRLDVDPLPHQIDLVHKIMTSDQTNWLIADDVGLGKTIEVGLLLAALRRRRRARRVLVVCPAGVVQQWQDEMNYKFNEDFRIYGLDFTVNQPSHWLGSDKVIVSIDRAKTDSNLAKFLDSGDWDVIVFDEAHHLSKGSHLAATQRFALAQKLRQLTDSFIFLTGTPHQGDNIRFVNMLGLLRPDLMRELGHVFTNPVVVSEMVLRNRKSQATNMAGDFIFQGQDSHKVDVPATTEIAEFNALLAEYVKMGYEAASKGGTAARAIGFVMTTYRKLASSSIPAIDAALRRRLGRLQPQSSTEEFDLLLDFWEQSDAIDEGIDGKDNLAQLADAVGVAATRGTPFFESETDWLQHLLLLSERAKHSEPKIKLFLDQIAEQVQSAGNRLLIFTEYRATQEYIVEQLQTRFPDAETLQIHGGMTLREKRANIAAFNDKGRFLVSTEAGGEGLNLHEACHVMVNYDIPWNPGRLVQRAGRLYRYGQKNRVVIFNLVSMENFDNKILTRALERVESIARDMAHVSSEFGDPEALEAEIIGQLLERLDIASILSSSSVMLVEHTNQEVETALQRAREAQVQQDKLFATVEGYDPEALAAMHTFDSEDVLLFLEGILPFFHGVEIRNRLYDGRVLDIRLPDELRGRYSDFPPGVTAVRITADRQLAQGRDDIHLMDFKSPFFVALIDYAQSPSFGGDYAAMTGPRRGTLGLYRLRWQSDQGVPNRDDIVPIFLEHNNPKTTANPDFFGPLIANRSDPADPPDVNTPTERRDRLQSLELAAENELAAQCTKFRHPNDVVLLAAADIVTDQVSNQ